MNKEPDVQGEDDDRGTIADRKKPKPGGKKGCSWNGKSWSHGGVVEGPGKRTFKCVNGEWVEELRIEVGDAVLEREASSAEQGASSS